MEDKELSRAMVARNWEGRLAAGGRGPAKGLRCSLGGMRGKEWVEKV